MRLAGKGAAALVGLGMLAATVAVGQTSVPMQGLAGDPAAPIEVESDSLQVDQSGNTATFQGHVVVVQDTLRLAADTVRMDYAPAEDGAKGRITRLTADGHVTLVGASEQAEAARAIYDVGTGLVTMSGDVLLTQGGNVISGQELVVDLKAGTGSMSGRVRTVLQPGEGR